MSEATRVRIAIGFLEFDGYMVLGQMDEDGLPIFGFSMSQVGTLLGLTEDIQQSAKRVIQKLKSKEAQARFPQGFLTHPNLKISDGPAKGSKVNILTIESFSNNN